MKQVWQAFDGKIFESEKECFDYEVTKVIPAVKYYFGNNFHIPSNQQEERDFMERAEYIFIPASELKNFKLHMKNLGLLYPETEGLWFWKGEEGDWERVEDAYQKLIGKVQEFNRVRKLAT